MADEQDGKSMTRVAYVPDVSAEPIDTWVEAWRRRRRERVNREGKPSQDEQPNIEPDPPDA